jgi:radical SAM superfamily enzyme YgiQ (UPF0313 family)
MIKALILAMPDTISNLDIMTVMPNMGIISLAGNVNSGLCDVKVADLVLVRERFEDYVLSLLREHSPDLVGFSCMTFQYYNLDLERLERLCEEITAARLNSIHYIISASVRGIAHSKKLVQKMADAGVRTVFLGIESTSKAQLDFLGKKNITSDNTRRAVRYLRDNGILSFGGFIVGSPDDDEETLWNTFKLAWDLRVDVPSFSILTPHVKTEIRRELMAEGLITNADDFSGYHNECANIRTRHLSPEEIEKTVGQMYETYLYNLDYLKFNQVRKIYPKYFWELVAKDFRKAVLSLIRNGVRQ